MANCYTAIDLGVEVMPVLNKIDLPSANPDNARHEIEEVIEVDPRHLLTARDVECREWPPLPGLRRTEFFRVGTDKVWGATYRILAPLLERLVSNHWQIGSLPKR